MRRAIRRAVLRVVDHNEHAARAEPIDAEPEGDELVLDIESMHGDEQFYLYLIYYLADDGRYDFYAELTDDEGLTEIMSDEEEDEEE